MIYVLLDTNIIIDMVVDRRHCINDNILGNFIKILDNDEIKIIVPEIIKTETFRHLENEVESVGRKLKDALKAVDDLYGISTIHTESLNLTDYKKNARSELNNAFTLFDKTKDEYKKDVIKTITSVFEHKNAIIIDDLPLMSAVTKRKIYKRAPFHKVNKESNGDGVITETLINLKEFIPLTDSDTIYFVTGNYKDFSSESNHDDLHDDIVEDLKENNLDTCVKYVRTFKSLVMRELKDSLKNAEYLEELQNAFEAEEILSKKSYEQEMIDLDREQFGMSSLGSFKGMVEDLLINDKFANDMNDLNGEFESVKNEIEELVFEYEDIIDQIGDMSFSEIPQLLDNYKKLFGLSLDCNYNGLSEIIETIQERINELELLKISEEFETLEFDKEYKIYSPEQEEYRLIIDQLFLMPSSGETDSIDITLTCENDINTASIEISYGEAEENEDGGIGYAAEEYIVLNDYGIVNKLQELLLMWKDYLKEETNYFDKIESVIV